ncbi:MAG TPA: hypothetical protein VIZ28_09905, partial [Chitinophagaceae bacterium]
LDTYLDALQHFPENCDVLQVAKGNAYLIKKDIFKNLMWYTLPDSTKQYPVTIESVKKIKSQNQQGVIPEALETVEVTSSKPKEVEPEFVDVVGQISLRSLDKSADKKRRNQQNQQRGQQGQRPQQRQGGQQGNQQGGQQNQQRPQQRNQQGGNQQRGQQPNQQRGQRPNPNQQRNQQNPNQQNQQRPNNPNNDKKPDA